jgi:hypothetical protein
MDNIEEIKKTVTFRRLSLCKQLFQNGYDSSYNNDSLSKIIAVHNMHNSIELFLRSLFLHYGIRQEKTINIEFDVMLNEIDNWCRSNGRETLQYRQELRNLNQQRNHVQHHAIEPEYSTMDYWRVYTRLFFEKAFMQFYDINFETFSSIDLINDSIIAAILGKADSKRIEGKYDESAYYSKLGFQIASLSLSDNMPAEGFHSAFFLASNFHEMREMASLIEKISERIKMSERFTLLLTSGINSSEYANFQKITPNIMFSINGHPHFNDRDTEYTLEICNWVFEKVINWILMWQRNGIEIRVPDHMKEVISEISRNGIDFEK